MTVWGITWMVAFLAGLRAFFWATPLWVVVLLGWVWFLTWIWIKGEGEDWLSPRS